MARTSAADLAHGLKGAHFPMNKKQLAEFARKNSAAKEIVQTIENMPEGEYGSLADVEHAFSQSSHKGERQPTSGEATGAARKGGEHSHGGRTRS